MKTALGYGWDYNFNWALTSVAGGADMVLKEGDGSTFRFVSTGDGASYETPPGSRMRLNKRADGSYTLVRHDNNLLYGFDVGGKLVNIKEPNNNTISLDYQNGRLAAVNDPTGHTITFTYNADGLITFVKHPGHTVEKPWPVSFEYDARGNLVQRVVYPDASEQAFTYGALGDQTGWTKSTVTDDRGFTVTYQVEEHGLLKKQSFPYGSATLAGSQTGNVSFKHDAAWNVTEHTDPRGGVVTNTYDGYGNPLTVTDPESHTTTRLWTVKDYLSTGEQPLNVPVQQTDPLGNTTVFTTDSRGNVTQVQDARLQTSQFTYNDFGLRTSSRDANGHVSSYNYDPKGWLLTRADPLGGTIQYKYDDDAGGNPSVITDPLGSKTTYVYDRLGRQTKVTYVDGSMAFNLYSGVGNLVQSTDPGGAVSRFEYDSRDRVVKTEQWPNADDEVTRYSTSYEYDSVGQLIAVTDQRGKRSPLTYDGAGRRLTSANPLGAMTSFIYDAAGNVTRVTDPLGNMASAEYDKLNRRTKTTVNYLTQTVNYDALGRKTSQKDAWGNTTS